MQKYMVIETFRPGCFDAVYDRFKQQGRLLPDGLKYLDSWVTADKSACYQLMQTDNPALFGDWIKAWDDLVDFEFTPLA
ncbi:MAG: DUF3303 domain-containing protein [Rhodobacteraceae bacterium]|nr:DUF3303 domain-containing protein [Paracoccaceae bacterium]